MKKQSLIILISFVIIVALGVIVYTGQADDTNEPRQQTPTASTATDQTGSDRVTRTIDALHQYQPDAGRHIVAGTTTVPTPCHQLSTDTQIQESNPQQVILSFSASRQNPDQMCAQQIQEVRFRVTFTAEQNARIVGGQFDGDPVRLNLHEVGPNENLDDFQIYTKG